MSLSISKSHTFSKYNCDSIKLIKGLDVENDAHMGALVKHRSRIANDPAQPNLRQVHLTHSELFEELRQKGFEVSNGQMGENITTQGIDLLGLPRDTILSIGATAKVKVTGLRNPCNQINSIKMGLMNALIDTDEEGNLIRKANIMGDILEGGKVELGDQIDVQMPKEPYHKLERV